MKSLNNYIAGFVCAAALIIASCNSTAEKIEDAHTLTKKAFEGAMEKSKSRIAGLYAEINSLIDTARNAAVTDTFVDLPDHFWFIPLRQDNSVAQRLPDSDFNALLISTCAAADTLPKGMKTDYFESNVYLDIIELSKGLPARHYGEPIDYQGLETIPTYARSVMLINQLEKMRYIVIVDMLSFDPGSLDYDAKLFVPATMEAKVMVYDRVNRKICGVKQLAVEGPEEFNHTTVEDNTNGFRDKNKVADQLEFYNKVSIAGKILRSIRSDVGVGSMR